MSRSLRDGRRARFRPLAIAFLLVWFGLAAAGSLLGVFDGGEGPPLALGAAAVLPVVGYAVVRRASPGFRRFVSAADLRLLTLAHTWRIGGVVFLILHAQGLLPGAFAFPAGWGDIVIGATAPLVAWALATRKLARPAFVLWNVVGILDLVMALALGILASPPGLLAGAVTTRVMGTFPLSLIPTFFVPLLIIAHVMALQNPARAGALAEGPAGPLPTGAPS